MGLSTTEDSVGRGAAYSAARTSGIAPPHLRQRPTRAPEPTTTYRYCEGLGRELEPGFWNNLTDYRGERSGTTERTLEPGGAS